MMIWAGGEQRPEQHGGGFSAGSRVWVLMRRLNSSCSVDFLSTSIGWAVQMSKSFDQIFSASNLAVAACACETLE